MFKRNRPPAAREVSQEELEQIAFETGQTITFGLMLATVRDTEGRLIFARLSKPVTR